MPSEGDDTPAYGCAVGFNTLQLNSALNIGSPTAEELPEVTLMGEITWREGAGEPTSTRTFLVVVENDVNRGDEGVPTDADPTYPAPGTIVLKSDEGFTVTLRDTLKSFDANTATIDQFMDAFATVLSTLKSKNVI
jgi:hypothetical protein